MSLLAGKYNLTSAEAEAEMVTWTNALAYRNATGSIDPAYDGFFLGLDLAVVDEVVRTTVPGYVPSVAGFLTLLSVVWFLLSVVRFWVVLRCKVASGPSLTCGSPSSVGKPC